MNWFISVGLGIGHIVKTWKNKKALLKMCEEAMRKHEDGGAGGGGDGDEAKDATHCLHVSRVHTHTQERADLFSSCQYRPSDGSMPLSSSGSSSSTSSSSTLSLLLSELLSTWRRRSQQ